ncbi:hemerythrin domain-containing protein [Nocardioides sp. CFH 31398]|uniref:hemerythrin domain-containing protein n=1 Tax=Nocardioides sp. CFH 31398 TaxID=2919579 RepID=UPI001F064823|nr:hemerythrin domain-containing protein [Nocardioides sp. CFH 31398]MCH1868816.1 hemerythrin domain-containing protein [Nocardioides sp. CFH 31398]
MTSLAEQTTEQLGGPLSVLAVQKRDHVRLDRLLHELDDATPGPEEDRVLRAIARLVFPHAFAEEALLWPVVRSAVPDGEALTLQVEREHQEVNELWTELETTPPGPHRVALKKRLAEVLREDVRDEEDELLPRLQDRVETGRLQLLGIAWEVLRRTAPTRPHPVVARRPPGNALAALPLTVIDRSRDALDAVAGRVPAARDRAVTLSAALAGVAGRVERWEPLRRGERPATHRA